MLKLFMGILLLCVTAFWDKPQAASNAPDHFVDANKMVKTNMFQGVYWGTIDRDPVELQINPDGSALLYTDGHVAHVGYIFVVRLVIPDMNFSRIIHLEGTDLLGHEIDLYRVRELPGDTCTTKNNSFALNTSRT